ncbi:MAG: methyl coenzyme M reductase subunit mcrA [Candidatus Methanoperedens nitroreducens]|uniref:Methyl-coenzyme M reductase subunit alpha n=3 Tax=Methanobacteriota TaxID=28890 RepID=A0A0P8CBK4_9EURY|nr:coenzyme-B sulfoethylthiotransferase subunit alpha [Candidatus Methanoperedens sp. BLZ2]KAB2943379.1 MAG: coenzyme-B sulfoethylthiotransferase subunit alpha [Candidatus Methanoperedens sp.]KPQ44219.1 MAG: methyl coenzyme M reductase subunit mcrA [Candidatus Methanoperedens sp. BLZ1]MBZ0173839.1 coenzyme-B sulfoethylthiotransferase subunit alpha [Candidatus Methanoperedens nitroreducens]MCX9077635.1 coenzyme-B sulfoethylthiotransferase subunit alpha [Candidatus Methanoperedens sp.]
MAVRFQKAMETKYTKEWGSNKNKGGKITDKKAKYLRLGYQQNPRKVEMAKCGAAITKKRGLQAYDPKLHLAGIPMGQRQLTPYTISGTDIVCDGDDLHFVNNAAMQQEWDDIRRSCVVGLDLAHEVLEKRLGKEVTPETINYYLEVLNHAMPGAAIVQEHMVETHPALVDDCYVKIFTGDETLQDEVDKQFVINIDNEFPANQAKQIKAAVGKTSWQAVHIPTIVTRTEDGPGTSRWMAMQVGMTFISAYHMCAGEAAVGELAFTAKHAGLVEMGDMIPARRARGPNEPGGLSFGHMADICQTNRKGPEDPVNVILQTASAATMLYDQIWLGGYMSGGVGFTMYATPAYTNDIVDDFLYWADEYASKKYGGRGKAKATIDTVKDIATESTLYSLEAYEKYPTTLEDHFGGSQRATVCSIAAGGATALATGHSQAGLSAWYLSMYLHKEAHGRLGFFGYDLQDQCGATNVFSIASDEGCIGECRGANYPNYAMNVGHQGGYTSVVAAAHAGKDAFCVNPLVKVCFADELINFDFADPRGAFGKAALREWDRCAGERAFVIPAK